MVLNDKNVQAAKPKDESFKLHDSNGLSLVVYPTGKKVWRIKDKLGCKHKEMTLGPYPTLSLPRWGMKTIYPTCNLTIPHSRLSIIPHFGA